MGVSHLAGGTYQERWQQGKPRRPLYRRAGETWSTVAADPRAHVAARAAALDAVTVDSFTLESRPLILSPLLFEQPVRTEMCCQSAQRRRIDSWRLHRAARSNDR